MPASLLAAKPGGSVITVVTCRDAMPEPLLAALNAVYSKHPEHTGRLAVDTFKSSQLFVEGAIDFNCAIIYALVCAARSSVTMVSRDLDERSVTYDVTNRKGRGCEGPRPFACKLDNV